MTQSPPAYMKRDQAATYLNISPRTLSEWQARRMVPYIKGGKCVLFKRTDLDAAMDRLTVNAIGAKRGRR